MKRNIKMMITVLAVCAVSAMAMMFTGCSVTDKIKQKIDQARCEHEWNDGEVTKEATCTEFGELTKTCTLCEKTEKEDIEKIDHVAVYVDAVLPTCVEKGLADGTVCSVCEQKIAGFEEVPALGHVVVKDPAVSPTCLESGLSGGEHCSRCDEVLLQQAIVPALGHNLVILPGVEATCVTTGKTAGVWCDQCKTIYTAQEEIALTEHIDENNDDMCDDCGGLAFSMAKSGEFVAGHTYRIYFSDMVTYLTLSNTADIYFYISSINHNNETRYMWCDSLSAGPLYYLEGLAVVVTDTYFEFVAEPGVYKVFKCDGTDTGYTYEINAQTTIVSSVLDYVYRVK